MAGLVAGPVQAAARHVGVGTAVRAAHDESVRAELERRMRPLPAGEALDGEGAAAVQSDLVLVPAAELAAAVLELTLSNVLGRPLIYASVRSSTPIGVLVERSKIS